jgi:type II secretory pathway pseudopilin PulG
MATRRHNESGDTLIEIVMAIVLIGLVVGAYFASFSTGAASSSKHQDLATADATMRDYAEAIKAAVRDDANGCGKPSPTTFTASYTPPVGFTVASVPSVTGQTCPPVNSVQPEHLTVTFPGGLTRTMDIEVRTP